MLTLVWPPFGHFLFKPHLGKIQEGPNKTKKQLTINTLCCFQYAFMWTLITLWTHQASRLVSVHVHAEITYIILLRIEPATFQLLDNPLYFPRNSKINPVLCIWPHVLIYIKNFCPLLQFAWKTILWCLIHPWQSSAHAATHLAIIVSTSDPIMWLVVRNVLPPWGN